MARTQFAGQPGSSEHTILNGLKFANTPVPASFALVVLGMGAILARKR